MGQAKQRGTFAQRLAEARLLKDNEVKQQLGTGSCVVSMAPYGYAGIGVQTNTGDIEKALKMADGRFSRAILKGIVKHMHRHFLPAFEQIKHGRTYWDGQELIDEKKFNADMIWFAVYNQLLNGTPFAVHRQETVQ